LSGTPPIPARRCDRLIDRREISMTQPVALPFAAKKDFRWMMLAALLALGGGCMTAPDKTLFAVSGPGWTVRQGQAIWRPGPRYPELAGEIVLAQNPDGRGSLQFTKTLLPVALAQTTRTNWLIQFPPQRLGFAGSGTPPQRFLWLHLAAALNGQRLPEKLRFTRSPDGGWRLENKGTGEFVEGFLSP
jgi:hypothetical protein